MYLKREPWHSGDLGKTAFSSVYSGHFTTNIHQCALKSKGCKEAHKGTSCCDLHCSVKMSILILSCNMYTLSDTQRKLNKQNNQQTWSQKHKTCSRDDRHKLNVLMKLCWSFLLPSPPPSSIPRMEVGDTFISPRLFFSVFSFNPERDTLLWCFMTPWPHNLTHTNL